MYTVFFSKCIDISLTENLFLSGFANLNWRPPDTHDFSKERCFSQADSRGRWWRKCGPLSCKKSGTLLAQLAVSETYHQHPRATNDCGVLDPTMGAQSVDSNQDKSLKDGMVVTTHGTQNLKFLVNCSTNLWCPSASYIPPKSAPLKTTSRFTWFHHPKKWSIGFINENLWFAKMTYTPPKLDIDTKKCPFLKGDTSSKAYIFGVSMLDFQPVFLLLNLYDLNLRKQNRTGISMRLACSSFAKKKTTQIHIRLFSSQVCGATTIYTYTWNPNDLYFWRSTPKNKAINRISGFLEFTLEWDCWWQWLLKIPFNGVWCTQVFCFVLNFLQSLRIHVWYIYLHENHKNQPNVGKYTIDGSSGNDTSLFGKSALVVIQCSTVSINSKSSLGSGISPRKTY